MPQSRPEAWEKMESEMSSGWATAWGETGHHKEERFYRHRMSPEFGEGIKYLRQRKKVYKIRGTETRDHHRKRSLHQCNVES